MKNKSEIKFIIFFILFWVLVTGAYLLINSYNDQKNISESFTSYKYYDIKNNYNSANVKFDLITDSFFINLASLETFNGSINSSNVEEIIVYYLSSINRMNQKAFIESSENICIKDKYFYKSFYELFNINLKENPNLLNDSSFVKKYGLNYCFDNVILSGTDKVSYVVINKFTPKDMYITGNLFYYSFYTNEIEEEEEVKNLLQMAVKNDSIMSFNRFFQENYNGYIEEKIIEFEELPNGSYFKYRLLSIKSSEVN